MLFPHQIMAYVFKETGLEIPSDAIRGFWRNAISGGERYASAESEHRIPLGLYGDAAQLITKVRFEKLLCLFINIVIWRPPSIRYSRFLIWSCDTSLLYKNRTINAALRWVVWSLNSLYHGTYPRCRPGNRPLEPHEIDRAGEWITPQKHQFQLVEIRGDWEWHKMVWQFKASWKGGVRVGICFKCPSMARCEDSSLLYWEMDDEHSAWATKEFTTAEFVSQRLPLNNIWILTGNGCRFSLPVAKPWKVHNYIIGMELVVWTCKIFWYTWIQKTT